MSTSKRPSGNSPDNDEKDIYLVEKILCRRVVGKDMMYLVKWKRFDGIAWSWIPRGSFESDQLLDDFDEAFDKEQSQATGSARVPTAGPSEQPFEKAENIYDGTNGFVLGHEPEKILGAGLVQGKPWFLITWKGQRPAEYIKAQVLYQRAPVLACRFFEKKVCWESVD